MFSGTVVREDTKGPLAGAEVSLPESSQRTLTDESGRFVVRAVAPGVQHVTVRRVGFGPIDVSLVFEAGRPIQHRFEMVPAAVLDSVTVTAPATDRALGDFEENRRLNLGHFLTRAELATQEGRPTGSVLASLPGIRIFERGPYAWVGSGRHSVTSLSNRPVGVDESDAAKGAPVQDCYALVYVDDHMVFRGQKLGTPPRWEPLFDVNSIPVAEVEAIEYYATAAQTPPKYATLNSECGVLVIHTIRYHPRQP